MDERQVQHAMNIDDAYVVERRLAHSRRGTTELVMLDGAGPFVRKRIPLAEAHRVVWAALAECSCALLPRVRATYEMPDEFVAVCDCVLGETVAERMERTGRLPLAEVAGIMADLCAAVGELHVHGIIHADIAPTNIVLAEDGAHLIDFGSARMVFDAPRAEERAWGTHGFAAPEQHGFAPLDTRADDTFKDYQQNVQLIRDWYDLTVSETESLGERTVENSKVYFQSVIDSIDLDDRDAVKDAIEAYYDAIYDDAYGDYYDAVYEDAYKGAYDQFYDGVLSDAIDTEGFDAVYDTRSDEYDAWSSARSDVYDAISDARSDVYDINSDACGAYYDDEFTMDNIFRDPVVSIETDGRDEGGQNAGEDETDAPEGEQASDSKDSKSEASDESDVSSDFKVTMDAYEAFFNEYADFMAAYQADASSPDLLAQYSDMMARYADTMQSLDDIDEDSLSAADYAYYIEVTGRITAKLASVAQ